MCGTYVAFLLALVASLGPVWVHTVGGRTRRSQAITVIGQVRQAVIGRGRSMHRAMWFGPPQR
jgi:hypothetical protein